MTSSRRSTRSARSINPTIFKTTLTKNSAPTSLSFVFAEPEQGLPLDSAISKLPSQESLRSSASPSSMLPKDGQQSANRERSGSISVDNPLTSEDLVPSNQGPAPNTTALSGDANRQDASEVTPEKFASTIRSETKSSWFGSLSRAKGKVKAEQITHNRSLSTSQMVVRDASTSKALLASIVAEAPSMNPQPGSPSEVSPASSARMAEPPNISLPSSSPQTTPPQASQIPARRSWFSSTPTSSSSGRSTGKPSQLSVEPSPSSTSYPSLNPEIRVEPSTTITSDVPAEASSTPQIPPSMETRSSMTATLSSLSTTPQDIPPPQVQAPAMRSWFSVSTSSPTYSPTPQTSKPSEVAPAPPSRGNVPEPPFEPVKSSSTLSISHNSSDNGAGRQTLSSLNPSSSRFALGVPLLGRTKPPLLEQAVSIPQSQSEAPSNQRETSTTKDVPALSDAIPMNTTTDTADRATEIKANLPPRQYPISEELGSAIVGPGSLDINLASSQQQQIPASSSWWDYLGWGQTSASDSDHVKLSGSATEDLQQHAIASSSSPTTIMAATIPSLAISGPETVSLSPFGIVADPSTSVLPINTILGEAKSSSPGTNTKGGRDDEAGDERVAATTTDGKTLPATKPPANASEPEPRGAQKPDEQDQENEMTPAQAEASAAPWYSPWTWYSASSSMGEPALPAGCGTTESGAAIVGPGGEDVKSNNVNVNVTAVIGGSQARENGEVRGGDNGMQNSRPRVEDPEGVNRAPGKSDGETGRGEDGGGGKGEMNAVEEAIVTHRSGWASFFSSKSLIMKRITATGDVKRDENGMEVMDIDEEEGEQDAQAPEAADRGRNQTAAKPVGSASVPQNIPIGNKHQRSTPSTPAHSVASSPTKAASIQTVHSMAKLAANGPEAAKKDATTGNLNGQKKTVADKVVKSASPAPSTKSGARTPRPRTPPPPNLLLPTWNNTFYTAPRNVMPPTPVSKLTKTMQYVSGMLFAPGPTQSGAAGAGETTRWKGKEREDYYANFGKKLPKAWDVADKLDPDILRGCKRVVVIGIHGWFPGAIMRTVLGEPTGTSSKFANMMAQALEEFQAEHNVKLDKITKVPLEGEGTISGRVEKLYSNLKGNQEWMNDIHNADTIFVATHSQGSVVSTHLLDCLIRDNHIRTTMNTSLAGVSESFPTAGLHATSAPKPQRVCCLALCGIHLGPLRYLSSSTLLQPYFQYFESMAARELFEFQNTESDVSKNYVNALRRVLDHGTKMVYVASLNDQVVPLYSGLFTAASHPLILRALYIDGDAYHSSDFLSNLLVLLLRMFNSGISDSGLLAHLSEATAGSLNGVGHSTAYEDLATYSLAVKYLFLTNDGLEAHPELVVESFNGNTEKNDYEIPWALRDVIADDHVMQFFSQEIAGLRDAFRDWHPKTSILRDLKKKLQPIQRLPSSFGGAPRSSRL